jgi:oligopeptidase A
MVHDPNPLLGDARPFPFREIEAEHVGPAIRKVMEEANRELNALAEESGARNWENTLGLLEGIMQEVRHRTAPVQHLLTVAETPELREAWKEVLPEISSFWSRLYLHEGVWAALQEYAESEEARELTGIRRRHLERTLRDFRRAGAELSPGDRKRLEEIEVERARLEQEFSEHVLDATAAWSLLVTDEDRLHGIPEDALTRFRSRADEQGHEEGWLLTLDQPSMEPVLKHGEDRSLREEVYRAHQARGTEEPWDNLPLIPRILELRREKALLLGYHDFPDYRLAEHMAGSGERARNFVEDMVGKTRAFWERDFGELEAHARNLGIDPIRPWDVGFVMQRIQKERFELDEEALRPYFPLEPVLDGLFRITERLFGLKVEEHAANGAWHDDVRRFRLLDPNGLQLGTFYTDFFPRPEKRQGAWLNDLGYGGPREDGSFEPHLAVVCANFSPPGRSTPSLLTHRDLETLFHEFGHLLHHCTSRVPIASRGGVSVAWDWVEVPSQLLQNWCWQREALDEFARHWKTGEPLPDHHFQALIRARRFLGGWKQMRQLGLGSLDLALHTEFDPAADGDPVEWVTDHVLLALSPNREFAAAHPLPSFLHLFSGGYSASYYSYLWSEVLEADLFTRFEERGIFDRDTGKRLLETILSRGDEEDPDVLFRTFMERDPDPQALIRRNLGSAEKPAEASSR